VAPVPVPGCTGVILAGGQAIRFGGLPKGLERVQGKRVIDRVADALRDACDELLLVANDPAAAGWLPGVPATPDIRPGLGSLGGLLTALTRTGGSVVIVAWDMPFVPGGLLRALREDGESGAYDAVLPRSDSRRGAEPLCAYYTQACAAPIERQLRAGDRRMIGFLDAVRVHWLDAAATRRFGDPARIFLNINEPADLETAQGLTDAAGE
jgi:molybdopterin-guanine dinucleotide biosynthesis protein A